MASTSTYLNFARNTEEVFAFYKTVFGTEYVGEIMRFRGVPPDPTHPMAEEDKDLIMHIQLPVTGGHMLHGTDAPESMGFVVTRGNGMYIMLEPDTRAEADRLFAALSPGGKVEMGMSVQFWGDYFGSVVDKYGVGWMINAGNNT